MKMVRTDNLDDERISLYTKYNEPQLYHINEPATGVFIAETPMVIERALDFGAKPLSFFVEEGAYRNEAVKSLLERVGDIDVFEAELSVINKITGFNLTRGVLAAFERPELPDINALLTSSKTVAVLEDIVNPTNVGAIFRSAAALGVDAILLTKGCTDPFYRRSARVSMGTVFQVPWTYFPENPAFTEVLHDKGYEIISMALDERAISVTDPVLKNGKKRAIVFGAEGNGISEDTLSKSDHIAIIPMHNGVDSLNVAASSAIAFWELCKTGGL